MEGLLLLLDSERAERERERADDVKREKWPNKEVDFTRRQRRQKREEEEEEKKKVFRVPPITSRPIFVEGGNEPLGDPRL